MQGKESNYLRDVVEDIGKLIIDCPYYVYLFISTCFISFLGKVFPKPVKTLQKDVILVTGAATGLGHAVVLQIAKKYQSTLVLWDINKVDLQNTSEKCKKLGSKVYYYVVDLTKQQDVIATAEKVRREVGHVSVLYNNAGLAGTMPFDKVDTMMEEKVIQVNLMSYIWTIREFLPAMIEKGSGHLVSTCSGIAFLRCRYLTSYTASKYGLRGFIETLKYEMRAHPKKPDIKISTVYPGWMQTPMTDKIIWEPRYRSELFGLTFMDCDYVAEKVLDGIVKETEDIYVPKYIMALGFIYGMFPTKFFDDMEKHLYGEINLNGLINTTLKTANPDLDHVIQGKKKSNLHEQ